MRAQSTEGGDGAGVVRAHGFPGNVCFVESMISSSKEIWGVLSCNETRKNQEILQEGEVAHRPLSLWITRSPILAPENGAESMYSDKSTPAGRGDRHGCTMSAGVTRPFGRNPALDDTPVGYAARCLTGPRVATKRVVNACVAAPARRRASWPPDFTRNQVLREEGRANKGVGFLWTLSCRVARKCHQKSVL